MYGIRPTLLVATLVTHVACSNEPKPTRPVEAERASTQLPVSASASPQTPDPHARYREWGTWLRRRGPGPLITLKNVTAAGAIDPAVIRRYIGREIDAFEHCYEKEVVVREELRGTIEVELEITGTGVAGAADARGFDAEVASCIADRIRLIEFPRSRSGHPVRINVVLAASVPSLHG